MITKLKFRKEKIEPQRRKGREGFLCVFPDRGKTDPEKTNPAEFS